MGGRAGPDGSPGTKGSFFNGRVLGMVAFVLVNFYGFYLYFNWQWEKAAEKERKKELGKVRATNAAHQRMLTKLAHCFCRPRSVC